MSLAGPVCTLLPGCSRNSGMGLKLSGVKVELVQRQIVNLEVLS